MTAVVTLSFLRQVSKEGVCVSKVGEEGSKYYNFTYIFVFLASQTWVLGRLLPVMIGHLVPLEDPYWEHFLQLLDMMELMFAPLVRHDTPAYLQVVVEENLTEFTKLYPNHPIIPKLHYLIHIPQYLSR